VTSLAASTGDRLLRPEVGSNPAGRPPGTSAPRPAIASVRIPAPQFGPRGSRREPGPRPSSRRWPGLAPPSRGVEIGTGRGHPARSTGPPPAGLSPLAAAKSKPALGPGLGAGRPLTRPPAGRARGPTERTLKFPKCGLGVTGQPLWAPDRDPGGARQFHAPVTLQALRQAKSDISSSSGAKSDDCAADGSNLRTERVSG
jgi:hypothetical protein